MKYESNHICTTNNEVEVGKEYQYSEEGHVCDVVVLEQEEKEDWFEFKLKVLTTSRTTDFFSKGNVFTCGAVKGMYAYSGMWRLYDKGTYI